MDNDLIEEKADIINETLFSEYKSTEKSMSYLLYRITTEKRHPP